MLNKKIRLVSVPDYLSYIKRNPHINFQLDIMRSNTIDIQVIGDDFDNEVTQLNNLDGLTIIVNFYKSTRDSDKALTRLLDSKIQNVEKVSHPDMPYAYIIKLERNIEMLSSILEELIMDIYKYLESELYGVIFYVFEGKNKTARQITHIKIPILEHYFGVKIKM